MRLWMPIPKDVICSKCGKPIDMWDGRRFRMKYRHYHCLPETRLRKITDGFKEAKRTKQKYKEQVEDNSPAWIILYEINGQQHTKDIKANSGGEALKLFRESIGKVKIITMIEKPEVR